MAKEKDPQKELIEKLDADRNYGKRTYKEVVQGVKTGALTIYEGQTLPILKDAETGFTITGTGVPRKKDTRTEWKIRFAERAISDFEAIYEALVKQAAKGDTKAIMYFMDRLMGSPAKLDTADQFIIDVTNKQLKRFAMHDEYWKTSMLDNPAEREEHLKQSESSYHAWQYNSGLDRIFGIGQKKPDGTYYTWVDAGFEDPETGVWEWPDNIDWDSEVGQAIALLEHKHR